jgi:hypothetical protein
VRAFSFRAVTAISVCWLENSSIFRPRLSGKMNLSANQLKAPLDRVSVEFLKIGPSAEYNPRSAQRSNRPVSIRFRIEAAD